MPRFGRIYADAVLRSLAEQLADALHLSTGAVIVDVLCDGGTLSGELARRRPGRLIALDMNDDDLLAARATVGPHVAVETYRTDGHAIGLDDESCDAAASLLTIGYGDPDRLVAEMRRVVRPGGRWAVATWGDEPPAHERILIDACAEVTGELPAYCTDLWRRPSDGALGEATVATMRDVIRFDGAHQYWDALLTGRGLNGHPQLREIRSRGDDVLEGFASADGTLRIPIELVLLSETMGEPWSTLA